MKASAWIAAASCCLLLLPAGGARAQGIRTQYKDGSGTSVGVDDRKSRESDLKKQKERMERRCTYRLDRAEKLLDEGRHPLACRELAAARNLTVTGSLKQRWMGLANRLNQIGSEQLKQADEAYRKADYPKALADYERIAATFAALPVAVQAREALSRVRDDPEVQAALKELRARKLFKHIEGMVASGRRAATAPATRPAEGAPVVVNAETVKALKDRQFIRVVDSLENLLKVCSGSPTGDRAGELLDRLRAEPATKLRLERVRRARRAEQALARANTYRKAGLLKKAAGLYRQVMKDFPGTPQAREAAAQLAVAEATVANP